MVEKFRRYNEEGHMAKVGTMVSKMTGRGGGGGGSHEYEEEEPAFIESEAAPEEGVLQ